MNRVWTEEELEILRRDREAKVPVPVTAAKLGRPVPATYARARLIGTLVQPHQSWDETSVARLRELVSADPPMTDKRIAAELGRTVTQIRWKMQDLGLIGVRDLSKLAKITAAETARPKAMKPQSDKPAPARPAPRMQPTQPPAASRAAPAVPTARAAQPIAPQRLDPQATLADVLDALESLLAERLKNAVAEFGSGNDPRRPRGHRREGAHRSAPRRPRQARGRGRRAPRSGSEGRGGGSQAPGGRGEESRSRGRAQSRRGCAPGTGEKAREEKARIAVARPVEKPKAAEPRIAAEKPKPVERKAVLPAVQGISQIATLRPAPQPAPRSTPKIVVTEAPAAARPVEPESASGQTSGRGGWKSVRRDPARILAQAKAKAKPANRADAIDLAQAAQSAIERFIAERGVTRNESGGIQAVISRLQARGYIVVRRRDGLDHRPAPSGRQRIRTVSPSPEARGITLSAAA